MSFFRPSRLRLLQIASQKINQSDAQIILAHVLKTTREDVFSHPEKPVHIIQATKFLFKIWRRKHGHPLAYLIDQKEFFGLNFIVNRHTLIPRPETEILIEKILQKKFTTANFPHIIDIGTGSGCIAITLAKNIPNARVFASDISSGALKTARINAKNNQVNVQFKKGSLLIPWTEILLSKESSGIIITANLPYLTNNQFQTESTIKFEPKTALISDNRDGLELYRQLFKQLHTAKIKKQIELFLEIDPDQALLIPDVVKKYFPDALITTHRDLCGLDRITHVAIGFSTTDH